MAFHVGLGVHLVPFGGRLFLDIDALGTAMGRFQDGFGGEDEELNTLRVAIGWQIARHLAIYAGPTYNVGVSWNNKDFRPGFRVLERVLHDGGTTVRLFPGFVAGVQL